MKKFFTLFAVVAMAASVNAQGSYAVAENDEFVVEQTIKTVDNATLTFMENKDGTYAKGKKTVNWADKAFTAYTVGKNNGKIEKDAAPQGCVYKIETAKAGVVTVYVQLSPNKGLHVFNSEFKEVSLDSYNFPSAEDAKSQVLTTNDKDETIIPADGKKSNGSLTFDVAAGGTYYVFAAGTKLGFFGFKYTVGGTTGISTVATTSSAKASATYNLAGQQVSDSYKGLVVKNGKKYMK